VSSSGPINTSINSGTLSLQNTNKGASAKIDSSKSAQEGKTVSSTDSVSTDKIDGRASTLNNILDGISQSLQIIEKSQGAAAKIYSLLREGAAIATEAQGKLDPPDLAALSSLKVKFNSLLLQVNQTAEEAGFKGVNLLQGDSLETSFGENSRSNVLTQGTDASAQGLGLYEATFSSAETTSRTLEQLNTAFSQLEAFEKSLAEDQSTIKTKQDFAQETIETFGGAQESVNTDEGANLLALKIGQQLSQLSQSTLASRDQQDLLRLF